MPVSERIANALEVYAGYLGKTFWPQNLAIFYPMTHPTWSDWNVGIALVILAGISACVLLLGRRAPYLAVGWLWYLGTLVPVIGLVQVGDQSMADRYTYVPLIGIFMMVVWAGAYLVVRYHLPARAIVSGVSIALFALLICTWQQVGYWRSNITLWTHSVEVTPPNVQAYYNLGYALTEQNDLPGAIENFSKGLQVDSSHEPTLVNRGFALLKLGEVDKAFQDFAAAVQANPKSSIAQYNLAVMYSRRNQVAEAIPHYLQAIELDPRDPRPHVNVAWHFLNERRILEAQAHFLALCAWARAPPNSWWALATPISGKVATTRPSRSMRKRLN